MNSWAFDMGSGCVLILFPWSLCSQAFCVLTPFHSDLPTGTAHKLEPVFVAWWAFYVFVLWEGQEDGRTGTL